MQNWTEEFCSCPLSPEVACSWHVHSETTRVRPPGGQWDVVVASAILLVQHVQNVCTHINTVYVYAQFAHAFFKYIYIYTYTYIYAIYRQSKNILNIRRGVGHSPVVHSHSEQL